MGRCACKNKPLRLSSILRFSRVYPAESTDVSIAHLVQNRKACQGSFLCTRRTHLDLCPNLCWKSARSVVVFIDGMCMNFHPPFLSAHHEVCRHMFVVFRKKFAHFGSMKRPAGNHPDGHLGRFGCLSGAAFGVFPPKRYARKRPHLPLKQKA